jgi:ribosomal protein S18 acetylase RimI-like enzyme
MIEAEVNRARRGQSAIRPVTQNDLPALKTVIAATGLFPPDLLDGMVSSYLSEGARDDIWLTLDEDDPVAIAFCAPEPMTSGTWNVYLIAVHPDWQGKGHGAALMSHIEQALVMRGERVLLVETSSVPAFERTRAFYCKIGYEEEARIREFYKAGEDKLVFRKTLRALPDPRASSCLSEN